MMYLVTVKLPKRKDHNPQNKKTAPCQLVHENGLCTDMTGEHHTFLVSSNKSLGDIHEYWAHTFHVTRIEVATVVEM